MKVKIYNIGWIFSILFVILLTSCMSTSQFEDYANVRNLTFKENGKDLRDSTFFKSRTVIPLETNDLALIGHIDRIYMADNRYFILDQNFRNILIYDKDGKYVNSIKKVGQGPKEYVDLGDICIDRVNKELLVLCTRPSKVQFYNYQGKFLREKSLENKYYSQFTTDGKYLYFLDDARINQNKVIAIYDRKLNHQTDVLEYGKTFKTDEPGTVYKFGKGNTMTQDSTIHFVLDYDNIVYEAKNGEVYPKYRLDFKQHTLPENLLDGQIKSFKFLDVCRDKQYVISVKEVIENSKNLLFTTNLGLFRCDKQSGEIIGHSFLLDSTLGIGSSDILVVGNSNKVAVVWPVARLKNMFKTELKNLQDASVKEDFLKKLSKMDEENNSILFVYEL